MYKLTIVIPVYKVEKYIEECLRSVIDQITPQVEVILVNDGTPDNSMEIAKKFLNEININTSNQFVIVNQNNQGLSAARNAGIEIAKGDYIGFLDSDDKLLPSYFSVLFELINNIDYDIIDFNLLTSEGVEIFSRNGIDDSIISVFELGNWFSCARIFNKSLFKTNSFKAGIYYEDLAFTPKMYIEAKKIKHINSSLYWYRTNPEGITHSKTLESDKKTIDSFEIILNYYFEKFNDQPNIYYFNVIIQTFFLLSVNCCRRFNLKSSLRYVNKYYKIIKELQFSRSLNSDKIFNSKFHIFYKAPNVYLFAYNLYCKLKLKNN